MFNPPDFESHGISAVLRRHVRKFRGIDQWSTTGAKMVSCVRRVEVIEGSEAVTWKTKYTFKVQAITYLGSFTRLSAAMTHIFIPGNVIPIQYKPADPDRNLSPNVWTDGELWCFFFAFAMMAFLLHWLISGTPWIYPSSDGGD